MPRNPSGTYTLPVGNPVVSGTLIEASWANNTLSDLGNEVTDSLSRSGEGAMLAPLRITDGVQATPSLAFSNEPSSGLYRAGTNEWWSVAAGVQVQQHTSTGAVTRFAAGAVGTPSVSAFNDVNTGIWFPAADTLAVSTAGVEALRVNSSGVLSLVNNPTLSGGTANGVLYLNGSKVATSGTALVFDGTNLGIGTSSPATKLHVNTGAAGYAITVAALSQTSITYQLGIDSNSNLAFYDTNAAAQRLVLDTSGNLGLGVTPSAWSGGGVARAIQVSPYVALFSNGAGNTASALTHNAYYDGTNWKYIASAVGATRYEMTGPNGGSTHSWSVSAGGTAGNPISFTQAMTLDASGNLLVGTTSASIGASGRGVIEVNGTSDSVFASKVNGTLAAVSGLVSATEAVYGSVTNIPMVLRTNNTERARITADGSVVAGGSVALATTATDGFLYVPTCAGTPTGTPTAITGMAPIVVNTTNNKLYFYSGGSWRDAGP
jgi:hypothetical protein